MTNSPCAYRGGYYNDSGSARPASFRFKNSTSDSDDGIGFRPALYQVMLSAKRDKLKYTKKLVLKVEI